MKGTSKVIMGATLVMVLTLALVLALVIVLLAELYCSLLLRLRRNTPTTSTAGNAVRDISTTTATSLSQPLSGFYAHGVLDAPRNLLFPKIQTEENVGFEKQIRKSPTSPRRFGVVIPSPNQETKSKINDCGNGDEVCGGGVKQFVYISNPIFENNGTSSLSTPFETPDTSPSRLEDGGEGSSSDGEGEIVKPFCSISITITPPLSPMKKLPKEACSVSLRDVGISGSDSNSDDIHGGVSSSSSGSPNTSPSW